MSESMVDKVARAIWNETLPEEKWEATPEPLLRQWRRAARAAIEAMRQPDAEMIIAGATSEDAVSGSSEACVAATYRAMITAALSNTEAREQ